MKKTIGIVAASVFAITALSAPVAADQKDFGQKDFGQTHKAINAGPDYENVGEAMKVLFDKPWGQDKKDTFFDFGN